MDTPNKYNRDSVDIDEENLYNYDNYDYDTGDNEEKPFDGVESIESKEDRKKFIEENSVKVEDFGIKPTKGKNIYCDKAELYEEIRKYQKDNNPTEKLGELLIKIAIHMSGMSRFWRYTHAIKEELVHHAIMQMLISVPKFNLNDEKKNPFGYLSMICYRDMLHSLKKHFKQHKVRNALAKGYIDKMYIHNAGDDRLVALRSTLEKNEDYNNFISNSKTSEEKVVDQFAISRNKQKKPNYSKNENKEGKQ